jgi:hypothetical protein
MKSGTTTLYKYLSQHPQIAKSLRKEPNFFGSRVKIRKERLAYHRLWPNFNPTTHRYALEASTHYTKRKTLCVARRMRRFGGEFRFIYIVRNPVDRIESAIAHHIAKGRAVTDLEELLDRTLTVSRYAQQLHDFRKGFPEARILLLDFEELKQNPISVAAQCAAFLDLDTSFVFVATPPANVRKADHQADKFRLTPEQRERLAEQLREDVITFRDHYGFDVSGWEIV